MKGKHELNKAMHIVMKSNLIDGYLLIKCDMMKIHAEKN